MRAKSDKGARIFGLLESKPNSSFTIPEIVRWLKDIKKPVVQYYLKEFQRDGSVIKPKYGRYQLNSSPPNIEAIREAVLAKGKERIIDTGRLWTPGEQALQLHDEHPAIPSRRLHFQSILERMGTSPAFSKFDVELLKDALPQLARAPERESAKTA